MPAVIILVNPIEAMTAVRRAHWAFSQVGASSFLHQKIVPELQERARARFASEGDTASGKWRELSPATAAYRTAAGFAPYHPINVRTGTLRDWVTSNQGRISGARGGVRLLWPGSTAEGGSAELTQKFSTAQRGISRSGFGRSRTPKRPVAAFGRVDQLSAQTALREWATDVGGLVVA